jgi:hypothetical protein
MQLQRNAIQRLMIITSRSGGYYPPYIFFSIELVVFVAA